MIIAITMAGLIASEVLISTLHDLKNDRTPRILIAVKDLAFKRSDLTSDSVTDALPTEHFPFRSPTPINTNSEIIIWTSSASHGEDLSYSPSEIFPNLICTYVTNDSIKTCLNHSRAGWTISDNIEGLKEFGSSWDPNFIVLYQMSLDIQRMASKQYNNVTSDSSVTREPFSNRIKQYLLQAIEDTTLFKDIREFIGSSLLIAAPLPSRLPAEANTEYLTLISDFVTQSHSLGAKPVLTTFAFSHASDDWESIPFRTKTWIMLWQTDLSPLGFIETIEGYNDSIRKFAQEHDVILVDIDAAIGGLPEYFRDPVHFNKAGHDKVAQIIAANLSSVEIEAP